MNAVIADLIGRLELGDPVGDGGLTLIPVFGRFEGVSEFVTLEEGIASGVLVVNEMSESGAVPMLRAHNRGAVGVLILDGEELTGAKQNRVLNTTVYIKPGQEIVIPVSCTEAGRWSYRSKSFGDSGYVAAPAIRVAAQESVTANVRRSGAYQSDQGRVWNEVSLLQERHNLSSPTSAARDVYENKSDDMRRREAAFKCLPGQTGLFALWSGQVAGLDVVAGEKVYARLHGRLVRSYALDAPAGSPSSQGDDRRTAQEWMERLPAVETTEHGSPGAGISYRFAGRGVVGSALAVDGAVLHAVAFATESGPGPDPNQSRYPGFFERRAQFPW